MSRSTITAFTIGALIAAPATMTAGQVTEFVLDARPFACTFNTDTKMALCGGGLGPNGIVTTDELDKIVVKPEAIGRTIGTMQLRCVVVVPYETPNQEIADAQRIWCAGPYESGPEQ